jgi:transposase
VVAVASRDLTDAQWKILEPYFASPRPDGRGRPWIHARAVLNGVLYVLRTGCAWADLPRSYPPKSTCHDRFQAWIESGVFAAVLDDLARDLEASGWLDLGECFIDGSFAPAKRGGPAVGKTKKGKGSKIMAIVEANGLPVAVAIDSANPHEVKLVEQTLKARFVETKPEHLIGDNAYDSDGLDADLAFQGIEMIAPLWIWQESLVRFGKSLVHLTTQWPPLAEAPALRAGLGIPFAPSFHRATKAITVRSRLDDVRAIGDSVQ